jgi:hypothetical protein
MITPDGFIRHRICDLYVHKDLGLFIITGQPRVPSLQRPMIVFEQAAQGMTFDCENGPGAFPVALPFSHFTDEQRTILLSAAQPWNRESSIRIAGVKSRSGQYLLQITDTLTGESTDLDVRHLNVRQLGQGQPSHSVQDILALGA